MKLSLNPQIIQPPQEELEEIEHVKPEILAKWRRWGVPENIIRKAIVQRAHVKALRKVEEWITTPNYAYPMPKLPDVEARPWGFAKSIDFEASIYVRSPALYDKIRKIDRWLYRHEYWRPRIVLKTRTYDLTQEIANLWHVAVEIRREYDIRTRRYAIAYATTVWASRAVRICYLTEPYLTVPEKKKRAREILKIYRERTSIPRI